MPFKIIETIEKGQKQLCIIPSAWESQNVLRWPRKRIDAKLVKDRNSRPASNWSYSKCTVKRLSIRSYEEALTELDVMVENSDTEAEETRAEIPIPKKATDFNALAGQLVNMQPEKSLTSSTPMMLQEATTAGDYFIHYVDDTGLATMSVDTHQNVFETQAPGQAEENTNINQVENYLKLILDNQYNMAQTIADNQKKIIHKLASLSVQIEEGFSYCNQAKNTDMVTLRESNPVDSEAFVIKPIDSVKKLEDLESLLMDKNQKLKLLRQYSFVCSQSEGKGTRCAYKILDMVFTREFLCKCSWTGGCRISDEVKVGLKKYKNILAFFFELVRSWDNTYTIDDNEKFFKIVLKNSTKRKLNKNERTSTKRRRTTKPAPVRTNVADNPSQDNNLTEMDGRNGEEKKPSQNNNPTEMDGRHGEEEEDDLC